MKSIVSSRSPTIHSGNSAWWLGLLWLGLLWIFLFTACLPYVNAATGDNAIVFPINAESSQISLATASSLLEDPDGKLTLADVREPANAARFEHKLPNIGFSSSAWWLHFTLEYNGSKPMLWWLNTGNRTLQEMDVFVSDESGVYQTQSASSNRPFTARPLHTDYFVFPVTLLAQKKTEIYIRVRSTGFLGVVVAPELWQPPAYKKMQKNERIQWLLYMGMVCSLALFNFMLCISIKKSYYLIYTTVVVSIAWVICSGGGGFGPAYEFFWPNSPRFEQAAWILSVFVGTYWPIQFVFKVTKFATKMPHMHTFLQRCLFALGVLVLIQAGSTLVNSSEFGGVWLKIHIACTLLLSILYPGILLILCWLAWDGNRQAKFLAVAWGPVLVSGIIWSIFRISGQKYNIEFIMWCSAFELILMSLALADRFNQEKKARARAQAAGVEILRRSETELEEKIVMRTLELQKEQLNTKQLLYNILPVEIANELSETGTASSAWHESVTILFTDFIDFTQVASHMSADEIVTELSEIFAAFDDITDACGVEKIKTIGDTYMAVAGLPIPCADHAQRCVRAAQQMVDYVHKRNERLTFKWCLRIGIHSGPVVSGVVGKRKFAFDIWGDTVNIAARIERAGENGRINVSAYTCDLIQHEFPCQYLGKRDAEGKGEVDMYFVT